MPSTRIQIDVSTHRELKKLAVALGATVGDTVALAVRRLRQNQIGADGGVESTKAEMAWLDADLR